MQFARPHDCRAKISKDFCAYIFGSHIRTPSQCKKVGIFHKIRWKNPQSERNFRNKIFYFYAPAYSKNSGRALSVTPVRHVRLSVPLSCPSHNSKTLWNIFMKLHRCIHHNKTMCHEQGRQLLHFWFLNYFPLTKFHIVNRVRAITPKPYGIYSWNFTSACITLIRCVMNKEDNSCIFGLWIISPWLGSI